MPTEFSDEEFCQRVFNRCAVLGRSARQVLMKAGIAHDFLNKPPARGRRIDSLERLAAGLDWTLADIMGFTGQYDLVVDQDLMIRVVEIKRWVADSFPASWSVETEARIQATAYNFLAKQRRASGEISEHMTRAIGDAIVAAYSATDDVIGNGNGEPELEIAGDARLGRRKGRQLA